MMHTTPRGFEPLRSKTTHLAGEPLNHSGKVSMVGDFLATRSKCRTAAAAAAAAEKKNRHAKMLHVGESNPGRLRDRQKCYQLHQRGLMCWQPNRPWVIRGLCAVRSGAVSWSTEADAPPMSYDHTTVSSPHPIRTAKLSTVGPN